MLVKKLFPVRCYCSAAYKRTRSLHNYRSLSTTGLTSLQDLVNHHTELVTTRHAIPVSGTKLDPNGVFTNSELRLSDVEVIGFDYDYTLAPYTQKLDETIFNMIIEGLVTSRHYPSALSDLKYDPSVLARGTHYDINNGVFMKVDAYHRIQPETVRRFFRNLSADEIREMYPGRRIFFGKPGSAPSKNYRQIVDIFEIPQLYAWCTVLDYLESRNATVHPFIVFEDINNATYDLHVGGRLHSHIMQNIGDYLEPNPKLGDMLAILRGQGKQLFILTNSPYKFIDSGMRQIMGPDWKDYFDVIICQSKKPKFFEDKHNHRVFRRLSSQNRPTFGEVTELKKGEIYCEGNVSQLHSFTGWKPSKILYFGDQMYADLAEPVLNQGWHTGAIIRELRDEIAILNSSSYQEKMFHLTELNYLINEMQPFLPDARAVQFTEQWTVERKQVRQGLRDLHPTSFGSIFRTHLTPSLFYRRLSRFAEIYTSDLTNLAFYNASHHRFTPVRTDLPHEQVFRSQLDCTTGCPGRNTEACKKCPHSTIGKKR